MTNNVTNMGSASTVSNSGHLKDYEFLPGVIVETDDPLKYGRIKVSAIGAFNANNSSAKQLPWCYPFMMFGNNSYASYEKGSKVWILRNMKRNDENWFIPMYEHHGITQDYVNSEEHKNKPEVISMRVNGGSKSSITYDHDSGYNISTGGAGGGASLNINTGSFATMSGGGSSVNVKDGSISLGNPGEDEHPAVLGDKLKELLNTLIDAIDKYTTEVASVCPETSMAQSAIHLTLDKIKNKMLEEILSEIVKICEITSADKAEASEKKEQEKINENKTAAKQKMATGGELTEEEYNSLDVLDQQTYNAQKAFSSQSSGSENTLFGGTKQNAGKSSESEESRKAAEKYNLITESNNNSMYNVLSQQESFSNTQSIPIQNVVGYDQYQSVLRQGH